MAKKSQKRQLQTDSNVNNDTKIDSPKKKLKVSPEKSEKKDESIIAVKQNDVEIKDGSKKNKVQNATSKSLDVETSNNTVEGKQLKKKNKKKVNKQEKLENPADSKTTPSESNNEESTKSKRKEMYRQKRAEHKEKRKLTRQQGGPSAALSTLSLADMKKRITDIEARETISKTAVRRLRILKKKVKVLESGGSIENLNEKGTTSENTLKENKKNKFEKKLNVKTDKPKADSNKGIDKKNKKKEKSVAKDLEKNLFVEDRVGDTAQGSSNDSDKEENGLNIEKPKNMKKLKKIMSGNSNIGKNNENEDGDEDIDEDDDKSENDSSEDINESDDEDSNEGENNIEKVKTEKAASAPKADKVQNKFKQDSNKPKTNPSETDPNKKQRYVLFVGNIAYDATTVDLKKHFLTKVEKVKDVRIPLCPGTNKPRGFGYVEVENSEDYEKALSLHHTFINGRQIKVEYTTSGSKKASRNPEVVHKNKKLHALRKDGKLAGSQKFSNKRSFRRNFKNNSPKGSGKKE